MVFSKEDRYFRKETKKKLSFFKGLFRLSHKYFAKILNKDFSKNSNRNYNSTKILNKSIANKAINLSGPEKNSTIIVVGNGRGGTSMIAGALVLLGVPMGSKVDSSNHEDEEIVMTAQEIIMDLESFPSKKSPYSNLKEILEKRNKSYEKWGWKDPSCDLYLKNIIDSLRKPRVIFVNRDLSAVADTTVREEKKEHDNLSEFLKKDIITIEQAYQISLDRINRYWLILQELCLPTLLLSYERAQKHPEQAVECLVEFCGISPTESQIMLAVNFMKMDRYTKLSDIKS